MVTEIRPHLSGWEKLKHRIAGWSPQVKQGLIAAAVAIPIALLTALGSYLRLHRENVTLRQDVSNRETLLQSNTLLFQIQAATIQSYQLENAKLSHQIAAIELERDPSAHALKRRAARLADEIFAFLQEWHTTDPGRNDLNDAWRKGVSEDFAKAFMEHADASMSHAQKMALTFAARFLGRLATIRDQLASFGVKSEVLDKIMRDKVRVQSEVQATAEELQKLADKIKE